MATLAPTSPVALSQSQLLRRGAIAAGVCGLLFLIGAAGVAVGFLRAAAQERLADDGWTMVSGDVVGERQGTFATAPDPLVPGNVVTTYILQPQVQVRYELGGAEQKAWVDVPVNGPLNAEVPYHHNVAQRALAPFHRGKRVACYVDPADGSLLKLTQGDAGRRTTITGFILTALASLPGIGLLLTGWLLWRAAKKLALPTTSNSPATAQPETGG